MASKEQKLIERALRNLKRCVDATSNNYSAGIDDLRFVNGEQWDDKEKQRRARASRPALTVNVLPKYIDQVAGDMRHNCPQIKFRAADNKADVHLARIREGLVQQIQYNSGARDIYIQGGEMAVKSGYGAWRVLTRWCDDNPFQQEIYIEAVNNPFLIYFDPASKDINYADARYAFILERMPREEFKQRFASAEVPGDKFDVTNGLGNELWYDEDTVTVAEYFEKTTEAVTMCQMEDGTFMTEDEYNERYKEWESDTQEAIESSLNFGNAQVQEHVKQVQQAATNPNNPTPAMPGSPESLAPQAITPQGSPNVPALTTAPSPVESTPPPAPFTPKPVIVKKRVLDKPIIKHYIMTCCEVLNKKSERKNENEDKVLDRTADIIPGDFIPLIHVRGKITNIEGKEYVYSLIRNAKDSQKLLNYWMTTAAETVALAPKSPWIGTAKQFEGYEADYANANVENIPYLKYNNDPEAQGPPSRVPIAQPPVAVFQQITIAQENIKSSIGMYNADMGDVGSEQTGAAILARQTPGDIGTYVFMDHLSSAIAHTGRIINSMIPYIYDTERDLRLRNVDDTEAYVPVNTTLKRAMSLMQENPERYSQLDISRIKTAISKYGINAKFNDLTVGKYDVYSTVGPSYATQRAESADMLFKMFNAMPQQMSLAADLIVENLDFKDADKLARRLRKTLPAGVIELREGEQPLPPSPPDPTVVLAQMRTQSEQAKLQMAQMKLEGESLRLEREKLRLQAEIQKLQLEVAKAATDDARDRELSRLMDAIEKDRRYDLELERLKIEERRLSQEAQSPNVETF